MKNFAMTIAAVASLGLAACGGAEQEPEAVTGEEVAAPVAPVDATTDESLMDVNAAANQAGTAAENALDNASSSLENASESIDNATEAVAQ